MEGLWLRLGHPADHLGCLCVDGLLVLCEPEAHATLQLEKLLGTPLNALCLVVLELFRPEFLRAPIFFSDRGRPEAARCWGLP
jgi:hypothetical protein